MFKYIYHATFLKQKSLYQIECTGTKRVLKNVELTRKEAALYWSPTLKSTRTLSAFIAGFNAPSQTDLRESIWRVVWYKSNLDVTNWNVQNKQCGPHTKRLKYKLPHMDQQVLSCLQSRLSWFQNNQAFLCIGIEENDGTYQDDSREHWFPYMYEKT